MLGLITDRKAANVDRLAELHTKGWVNMTASERAEWYGDPLDAAVIGYTSPVNIIPTDYISVGASLEFRNRSVTATSTATGTDQHAVILIEEAGRFEGATLTLSVDEIHTANGGEPTIALYWYDAGGRESAGITMSTAGSKTVTLGENTAGRSYLALCVYARGGVVRYNGLMLEVGSVRHDYVPYTPILPTNATKGAYNYADLNRVEKAVSEIAELLGLNLETKTNWSIWDVPTDADTERYLGNVERIRNACSISVALPSKMAELNYEAANNIETILNAAYEVGEAIPRTGELYCGEV